MRKSERDEIVRLVSDGYATLFELEQCLKRLYIQGGGRPKDLRSKDDEDDLKWLCKNAPARARELSAAYLIEMLIECAKPMSILQRECERLHCGLRLKPTFNSALFEERVRSVRRRLRVAHRLLSQFVKRSQQRPKPYLAWVNPIIKQQH